MPKQRGAKRQTNDAHGDNIAVGNVTKSTGVAIGRGAQATVTQTTGVTTEEIAKAFAAITAKVNALPEGPDKTVAASAVKALQDEAQRGDKASETNVNKWFNFLAQAAPDAFDVAVATFANPIAGLGMAFKKIAERAKEERQAEK
jgi:hypothetical protein